MRQIFLFVSIGVLGFGLYLRFFYDVPDSQITTNFFTSWFLIIVGVSSLLMNLFWANPKKNNDKK